MPVRWLVFSHLCRWFSVVCSRLTRLIFTGLREALEKLSLNDSSFSFEAETSAALGFGFRCGFLGLLHMEVIRERLSREFNLDLISTAPSVVYQLTMTDGSKLDMHNPADMPEVTAFNPSKSRG